MSNLPLSEEIDFAYLLELMQPLHKEDAFSWLPELFSIVGHERLILLCKYAGGELIRVPTAEELSTSIEALRWFYRVYVSHTHKWEDVPAPVYQLVSRIVEVFNVRNG